jgi:hypothetical protein
MGIVSTDGLFGRLLQSLFQKNGLVDVAPTKKVATWRNGRLGDACISKRLDRFLIAESLISSVQKFRTWVEYPYLSDHAPVLMEFRSCFATVASPFKLNPEWLKDDSFVNIVRQVWNDPRHLNTVGAQRRLVKKLSLLKERVKVWAKEKRQKDQDDLSKVEKAIDLVYTNISLGSLLWRIL